MFKFLEKLLQQKKQTKEAVSDNKDRSMTTVVNLSPAYEH